MPTERADKLMVHVMSIDFKGCAHPIETVNSTIHQFIYPQKNQNQNFTKLFAVKQKHLIRPILLTFVDVSIYVYHFHWEQSVNGKLIMAS